MQEIPIKACRNLGASSEKMLASIDVRTLQDLIQVGVVETYCLVKAKHEQVSLNLLYALYGAVHDIAWQEISPDIKAQLLEDVKGFRFGK